MPCNLSTRGDLGLLGVRIDPEVNDEEGGGEMGGRNQGSADQQMPDVVEEHMETDASVAGKDWSNAASFLNWV